ncbi:hypothetical protein MUP77_25150 [Candidatus Bathyarchaeota archaeon]|nr:hypothetical protein [Candidatus Bathyarchaeota archaeon]
MPATRQQPRMSGSQRSKHTSAFSPVLGVRMATGGYTGDGAATQAIAGVGFRPSLLMVWQETDNPQDQRLFKTDQDGLFAWFTSGGTNNSHYLVDMVVSFDADGFTVGDGTGYFNAWNTNLVGYRFAAWGGSGASNIKTGAYVGNGAATQAIVGVGFQPKLVIIMRDLDSDYTDFCRPDTELVNTWNWDSGFSGYRYVNADLIVSFDVDGFTVGDGTGYGPSPNTNLGNYKYACFR